MVIREPPRSVVRSFVHSFIHSFIAAEGGKVGGTVCVSFYFFLLFPFFFIYIFFCLPLNYSVQFFFYGAFAGGRSGWLRRLNLKKKCCFGNWRWNKKQLVKQLFCGNRRLIITSTKKMTSLTHFDGILAIFKKIISDWLSSSSLASVRGIDNNDIESKKWLENDFFLKKSDWLRTSLETVDWK